MSKMRNAVRTALVLLAAACWAPLAHAQSSIEQKSVDRAHAFLVTADCGKNVLGYVHFGAQYKGHGFKETRGVVGKPADFALIYRFNWENDGISDVAFFCNKSGNIYEVQVPYTNARLQQPFVLANASIKLLGDVLLEAFRERMTQDEINQARQVIDNANARGLLAVSLGLQQAFVK